MTAFSHYVYAMGRGPSNGRNLTQDEARDAMEQILDGSADPHAVGALLMLMRYRGETPEEIAGFVKALQGRLTGWDALSATVDWPSYAAGRTRGLPWFLLVAKLVAQAGHRVFLHGWNSNQASNASVLAGVTAMGLPVATSPAEATAALAKDGLVYCPLEALDPDALRVLKLRDTLGLRSAINTALRGYNPTGAPVTVQGVFHPSYRALQSDAAALLGQDTFAVIKGGGGEFEVNPSKDVEVYFRRGADSTLGVARAQFDKGQRLADRTDETSDLTALWAGQLDHPFAEAIVTSTAAVALQAITGGPSHAECLTQAKTLWRDRHIAQGAAA